MKKLVFTIIFWSIYSSTACAGDVFANMGMKMKYLNKKQSVLSQNIANADTPGYRAKKLEPLNLKTNRRTRIVPVATSPGHITPKKTGRFKVVRQNNSSDTTLNGNDVDLEEQMIKMSENDLEYRTTTGLMRQMNNLVKAAMGPAGG